MSTTDKFNIVIFWFMNDWGKYGRAYEKIAENLAEQSEVNRVICILPPQKIKNNKYSWPITFSKISKKLLVLNQNSAVVPTTQAPYKFRKWINLKAPELSFSFSMKLLGIKKNNTILWLYPPHEYINHLSSLVPHFKKVVQVVDNNSFLEAESEKYRMDTKKQYELLTSSADSVIVSSDINYQFFSAINEKCFIFENAVDKIFLKNATTLPCKDTNSRPRLGYLGWLTKRTDLRLIHELASKRPEYDIVLAGPVGSVDISKLISLQNVSWIGSIPYDDAPDIISSFDVCLIPHIDSPYTRSMSPLKLFQYLGSGRPIVSTRVAGVERWGQHVLVSDGYDDFIHNVDIALDNETIDKAKNRILAVSEETWDKRIKKMLKQVLESSK